MKISDLDDPKIIEKYDRSGMLGTIESFPGQCLEAKDIGSDFKAPARYDFQYHNIVCSGLAVRP